MFNTVYDDSFTKNGLQITFPKEIITHPVRVGSFREQISKFIHWNIRIIRKPLKFYCMSRLVDREVVWEILDAKLNVVLVLFVKPIALSAKLQSVQITHLLYWVLAVQVFAMWLVNHTPKTRKVQGLLRLGMCIWCKLVPSCLICLSCPFPLQSCCIYSD